MNRLFFPVAICLTLYAQSQSESDVIQSMHRTDSLTRSTVKTIDNSPPPAILYDTLTRCENGGNTKIQIYYTYTYDLDGSLLKVKVFDTPNETVKHYYYLHEKMIHVKVDSLKISDGTINSRSWRSMNFHYEYSPLTTYVYNESTIEHIQFLVDGYKLLVRFKDLRERRS